ncbi:Oidioi.mRNA.OKI2018_I69.chr1.g427.t1.cds [Oikopleura dioica]|uniref:Oidioi.mRNA.OKI2018_I69.chr1.g427.t1.cds n=1 Tax=Oikopleura dioica TaxID=34765 RepID=A0ABN7SQ11_OIKDI|nr:Oidioi.mRNA.OKI2018_I69.chr1.g427.t1.cds [Oikopleura dioica]
MIAQLNLFRHYGAMVVKRFVMTMKTIAAKVADIITQKQQPRMMLSRITWIKLVAILLVFVCEFQLAYVWNLCNQPPLIALDILIIDFFRYTAGTSHTRFQ